MNQSLSTQDSRTGFQERFAELLSALGISQNELARQLGSTSAFMSNLARGKSKPSLDLLEKIGRQYNVSMDWLILGKGEMREAPEIDGEFLQTIALRMELARLIAIGDAEANELSNELLGKNLRIEPSIQSKNRYQLLHKLSSKVNECQFSCELYRKYLPSSDHDERNRRVLIQAIEHQQAKLEDPLTALLFYSEPSDHQK
ncbi:MAG: helix-turn-helix transcriptional regulator [Oceanobacter sp.]